MLKYWIWLATRDHIDCRGQLALLRLFRSPELIYELKESELRQIEGLSKSWAADLLDKSLEEANRILDLCEEKRISILTYADEAYPTRLKNISDPPIVLYYKGKFPAFDAEAAIAVVGSRSCSAYGLLNAKEFGKSIACSGGVVISGGARGVDTVALRAALESQTPVVCVLGCGVDVVYPRENRELFTEILYHGCIISEYPPGTKPLAFHFPKRNRIISGLSLGVLVVEAPERSGALITANLALEQGRDVYAIPGNIDISSCVGSNRLLREGAAMVECGWDIMSEYLYLFPDKLFNPRDSASIREIMISRYANSLPVYNPINEIYFGKKDVDNLPKKAYSDQKEITAALTEDEKTVLALLSGERTHADILVDRSGLSASKVMAALTMLQIKGLAAKLEGNCYQRINQ